MRRSAFLGLLATNLAILVATSPVQTRYTVTDVAEPVAIELSPEVRELVLSGSIDGGPEHNPIALSLAFEGFNSAPASGVVNVVLLEEGAIGEQLASVAIDAEESGVHEVAFSIDTSLDAYGEFRIILTLGGDAALEGEVTATVIGWAKMETEGQSIELSDITVEEVAP